LYLKILNVTGDENAKENKQDISRAVVDSEGDIPWTGKKKDTDIVSWRAFSPCSTRDSLDRGLVRSLPNQKKDNQRRTGTQGSEG